MRGRLGRATSWVGLTIWPLVAAVLGLILATPIVRLLIAAIIYFGLVTAAFFVLNLVARLLGVNFDNPGPAGSFLITVVGLIAFIAPLVPAIRTYRWIGRWLRGDPTLG